MNNRIKRKRERQRYSKLTPKQKRAEFKADAEKLALVVREAFEKFIPKEFLPVIGAIDTVVGIVRDIVVEVNKEKHHESP